MHNRTTKNLNGVINFFNNFLYGKAYPSAIAALVIFSFAFGTQAAGLFIMIFTACLIFIFKKDLLPVLPLFLYFLFLIKDYSVLVSAPYLISYAALVISIIFHFIRFRHKLRLGQLFLPLVLLIFALVSGGSISIHYDKITKGLAPVLTVGPLVLVIYLVFLNGIDIPNGFDIKTYIAFVMIMGGIILGAELFLGFYYVDYPNIPPIPVFWGNTNTFATVLAISLPMCFYFILKTGYTFSGFTAVAFIMASLFRSKSDGCIGITRFSLPFLLIFTYVKLKPEFKRRYIFTLFFFAFIALAVAFYIITEFSFDSIKEYVLLRTHGRSRLDLFDAAIAVFKKNPLFGAGLGYTDDAYYITETFKATNFNFHSTIFHTLATMGIFGLAVYVVYYYFRFRIIIKGRSNFNAFVYLSFLFFLTYGIVDPCEFNVIPILSYITALLIVAERFDGVNAANGLPLTRIKYRPISFN